MRKSERRLHELEWKKLQAMRPTEDELKGLQFYLRWRRLPRERKWPAKTAPLPGM